MGSADGMEAPVTDSMPSLNLSPPASSAPQFVSSSAGSFASESPFALGSVGGYIDSAIIRSRIRVRYDTMQRPEFANRAGYLYAPNSAVSDTNLALIGIGGLSELRELSTYMEMAFNDDFSVFVDVPVRWIYGQDPNLDPSQVSAQGLGDIRAGARLALWRTDSEWVTAQVRATAPTGDEERGLGFGGGRSTVEGGALPSNPSNQSSVEVSILFQKNWDERFTFFGHISDWQAINGPRVEDNQGPPDFLTEAIGDFWSGNILTLGGGVGVNLWSMNRGNTQHSLAFVFEVFLWEVLDGYKGDEAAAQIIDATGDTIVNGKYGLRYNGGRYTSYVGWGQNWTSDLWYEDLFRLEVERRF
jgi:hypothetical protein